MFLPPFGCLEISIERRLSWQKQTLE